MPTQVCAEATCIEPATYRGRCADHARTNDRSINRAGTRVYSRKRWRKTRELYLREHPFCERCGALGNDVHHRTDLADGGDPWDPANLEALCHACHSRVTRRRQADALV
jgi:5-methylcytosine-specific restriction enzyme A